MLVPSYLLTKDQGQVGGSIRLLMLVRTKAEVLNSLPSILGSPDEKGIASSRRPQCKLVKGQSLASGCLDPGASGGGESQSSDGKFGDREETVVVSDGTNNNYGLIVVVGRVWVGTVLDDAGDRDRGPVDLGHEKTTENSLIEGTVGTA